MLCCLAPALPAVVVTMETLPEARCHWASQDFVYRLLEYRKLHKGDALLAGIHGERSSCCLLRGRGGRTVGGRWEQGESRRRDALGNSPHLALWLFFVGITALLLGCWQQAAVVMHSNAQRKFESRGFVLLFKNVLCSVAPPGHAASSIKTSKN